MGGRTLLGVAGPPDRRVAAISGRQRGLVSRRQLLAAGLSDDMVKTRVARGQLTVLRRGVYALGPTDAALVRETAALLVCGPSASLSHLTAVRLWELLPGLQDGETIDVTAPASNRGRSHRGIAVRRSATLTPNQIKILHRLPVTCVERTLIDAGPLLSPRQLERALDEALARRLTTAARLGRAVAAAGSRQPGAVTLRRLLQGRLGPSTVTHSEAEERLLALIRQAELPEPQLQARLHGYSVDVYWPQARFAVELDGYAWHTSKTNFNRDRRKDRALANHGVKLTRVTWDQLHEEPLQLIAHFARHLPLAA